ncbi:N(4)-(Beta-N-acetylglucosaminyl)-L-asparaginase-like [Daktulosphaira vitifoliae]|uniref:N(4)-(Beta-N-acetylglucosaminyl)-L-asparaginase- like n=1 Tax=Daktulosphaira vitifoliae TaxID=58002 RepID=UPI0021AA39B3|nr:N(4)-(Beta-N-acetylglucosaminyl)-L-asparaginase-like [Daktulosphaira vitifoliae]
MDASTCLKIVTKLLVYVSLVFLIIVTILTGFYIYSRANTKLIIPIVINTWAFQNSASKSWEILNANGTAIEAVVEGCSTCEISQCDGTVGFGGSPDENGESTLDALLVDGATMNVGAVGGLKRIKQASKVAQHVMENTKHTLLVGEGATQFAIEMGFKETNLSTNSSLHLWNNWKKNSCQPNFWINVTPNPEIKCGPYKPHTLRTLKSKSSGSVINRFNHDTIGVVAIDNRGNIAAGTSTNGAKFKIPGRVGDSPIPGSGAYAMNNIGAAAATGDGDILMRFLPSFQAVQLMKQGYSPEGAAILAMNTIADYYPEFTGAIVVVDKFGNYGAACYGLESFPYSVASSEHSHVTVMHVKCQNSRPQYQ